MLVQLRHDGRLRLFRQHDHALLSGELASCWRGAGREPDPLPFDLVLAIALHDLAWLDLDDRPRLDSAAARPYSFHEFPLEEKLEAYRKGLDRVAALHPYAALLESLHYTSFPDARDAEEFQETERRRRKELEERLGLEVGNQMRLRRHLAYLQLFDRFSLFVCLTPPSAAADDQPSWVESARHLELPGGGTIHLTWLNDEVLHVDPFPFRDALELRIPYREMEDGPFGDQEELDDAWREASEEWWSFAVRPAPRLA